MNCIEPDVIKIKLPAEMNKIKPEKTKKNKEREVEKLRKKV